ncbi:WecB/TagA/CpsF family glycosyltransferase [Bosea sp. (in: a-proteobacteria)]|uniref:WecB/TagA/CpsF family glycosyltransferase n=1 Tax=Bosea sp. (in: a-proteobacteria) TaxID=1871050 RepID=UPI002608460F|nr:WecB/TagA/CpsF family glycosyltransferase [Bosea sp. (in: a-proteobacteria)]MCO5090463.1 WecB/TagA/CpsF family glycosyltransferase [Bosea sp. (in: a-proteobacteria)]
MSATASILVARDAGRRKRPGYAKRDIGGIGIAVMGREAAIAEVIDAVATGGHVKLAFCNANLVNVAAGDAALQRSLSTFLVLADGIGVDLGSLLLYRQPFPANLNGTDFFPALFDGAGRSLRVALLGGRPGVADRAAAALARRYPAHRFTVVSHGYFAAEEEGALLDGLKRARPDLLLVAMGNPLQERFIADRLGPQHCAVAAGVGALFDFFAGEVPRAPEALRRARLEWIYRLWREPRRLWRRYVLGNPAFLMQMARQYAMGGRRSR